MELTHEEKMALLNGLVLLKDKLIGVYLQATYNKQKTQDAIDTASALFEKIRKADWVRVGTSSVKDEAFCAATNTPCTRCQPGACGSRREHRADERL